MVSGLLGVGGGIVIIPLLVLVAAMTQHQAHATSLAAIIPIAAVGAGVYGLEADVGIVIAVALGVGALLGAPLGARAMARSSERVLQLIFLTLQILVGLQLLLT